MFGQQRRVRTEHCPSRASRLSRQPPRVVSTILLTLLFTGNPLAAVRYADADPVGNIYTVAGALGEGTATEVAQWPQAIAASGHTLYVADTGWGVIRSIDLASGIENLVAGNGNTGSLGDGGPARAAEIHVPKAMAISPSGDLYFTDGPTLRRVALTSGTISTVAGVAGVYGSAGDGGLARDALLNNPGGLAFDAIGNLFVADQGSNTIRRIDTLGVIGRFAGTGVSGSTGDGGLATSAQMVPLGVAAMPNGTIYLGDGNGAIRKIDTAGIISTVAYGRSPVTLASGPDGVLHFADPEDYRIRTVNSEGQLLTEAGTGTPSINDGSTPFGGRLAADGTIATSAPLNFPRSVTVDAAGTTYFTDGPSVRRITSARTLQTVAGTSRVTSGDGGPATSAQLSSPVALAVNPSGSDYDVSDSSANRIRRISGDGIISPIAGSGGLGFTGDGALAVNARMYYSWGMTRAADGSLYFADYYNNRVRKVDSLGVITTVAGGGSGGLGDGGPATSATLFEPTDVAVNSVGDLFIADWANGRVRRVDRLGNISTYAGTGGQFTTGDGGPATSAGIGLPWSIAVDRNDNVLIAAGVSNIPGDPGSRTIRRVDHSTGVITRVVGSGAEGISGDGGPALNASLTNQTHSLAVDSGGDIFFADGYRVRRVDAAGIVTTIAGQAGAPKRAGDGGPAIDATLGWPSDIAVDAAGGLLITDGPYIRRVEGVATPRDTTPPRVTGAADRAPNGAGWYSAPVTVTWTATDPSPSSGGPTTPASTTAITEGQGVTYSSAPSCDPAGNCATGTATVSLDRTAPSVTASAAPSANAAGWNRTPVTVSFTCSDLLSGVAVCPPNRILSTESAGQSVSGTAIDRADNTASATVAPINVDLSPPTIAASTVTGTGSPRPLDGGGWYIAPVRVHFSCADALSGLASCASDQVVSTDGANVAVGGTSADMAGNSASTSANLQVDGTAPTSTATLACTGGGGLCRGSTATVTLAATDALSGPAAIHYVVGGTEHVVAGSNVDVSVPLPVSSGSANLSWWAVDVAGNAEASHTTTVSFDNIAPVITHVVSPAPNGAGWDRIDTTVHFDATDDSGPAGIASVTPDQSVTTDTPGVVIVGSAADIAGNTATDSVTIRVDKTPPAITSSLSRVPDHNGWYTAVVGVHYVCADATSGVATCAGDTSLTSDGASQSVSGTAADIAGNTATTGVSGINIDTTPPIIAASPSRAPDHNGWYRSPVSVHFTCSDATSGVATCPADVTLSGDGASQSVSGTAIDVAGKVATATVTGINIDRAPPTVATTGSNSLIIAGRLIPHGTMAGTAGDALSGVDTVTVRFTTGSQVVTETASLSCDGARHACTWEAPVPYFGLIVTWTVVPTAIDIAGNTATGGSTQVTRLL